MRAVNEDGEEKPSEPLENIFRHFPAWMGPELQQYAGKEADLPFDCHDLKALVAPRVLLDTEAAGDIWANPAGTFVSGTVWLKSHVAPHLAHNRRKVCEVTDCEDAVTENCNFV